MGGLASYPTRNSLISLVKTMSGNGEGGNRLGWRLQIVGPFAGSHCPA